MQSTRQDTAATRQHVQAAMAPLGPAQARAGAAGEPEGSAGGQQENGLGNALGTPREHLKNTPWEHALITLWERLGKVLGAQGPHCAVAACSSPEPSRGWREAEGTRSSFLLPLPQRSPQKRWRGAFYMQ